MVNAAELECLRCGWRWLWEAGASTGCKRCGSAETRTYEPDHDESEDE